MEKGVVIFYGEDKGFGFIRQDDEKEVLVERSSFDWPGFRTLNLGERISFDVRGTPLGLRAENVKGA